MTKASTYSISETLRDGRSVEIRALTLPPNLLACADEVIE